jgi:hypothetical protein
MKKSLLFLFTASALPASSAIVLDTEVRLLGNLECYKLKGYFVDCLNAN